MTCQELLAFSVAFSAALPTGQTTLESFYSTLTKPDINNSQQQQQTTGGDKQITLCPNPNHYYQDFSCCIDLYQNATFNEKIEGEKSKNTCWRATVLLFKAIGKGFSYVRQCVRLLVQQKYFQQGILLAILINTLSMGIEYHNQPEELTAIVETSNIVFSGIFAVEMLLKVIAEGPFKYIANGFNVFDGVIVILRLVY